jgi:hypothetical protein
MEKKRMGTTRILYDLRPYLAQNSVFHRELQSAIASGALSIAKIFQILPLNVARPFNGRQQLEHRGDGYFRRHGTLFTNDNVQPNLITFLDDQLGEIFVTFPQHIKLTVTGGSSITVSSVGDTIAVRFKALPTDFPIKPPIRFDNFIISESTMITQFVDAVGEVIILDGSDSDLAANPATIADILKALSNGADSPCPVDSPAPPPPQQNWHYAIYRSSLSGYCRIITPGFEWGDTNLGTYDTRGQADAGLQHFLNDGEPPYNTNPTCEGSG